MKLKKMDKNKLINLTSNVLGQEPQSRLVDLLDSPENPEISKITLVSNFINSTILDYVTTRSKDCLQVESSTFIIDLLNLEDYLSNFSIYTEWARDLINIVDIQNQLNSSQLQFVFDRLFIRSPFDEALFFKAIDVFRSLKLTKYFSGEMNPSCVGGHYRDITEERFVEELKYIRRLEYLKNNVDRAFYICSVSRKPLKFVEENFFKDSHLRKAYIELLNNP